LLGGIVVCVADTFCVGVGLGSIEIVGQRPGAGRRAGLVKVLDATAGALNVLAFFEQRGERGDPQTDRSKRTGHHAKACRKFTGHGHFDTNRHRACQRCKATPGTVDAGSTGRRAGAKATQGRCTASNATDRAKRRPATRHAPGDCVINLECDGLDRGLINRRQQRFLERVANLLRGATAIHRPCGEHFPAQLVGGGPPAFPFVY